MKMKGIVGVFVLACGLAGLALAQTAGGPGTAAPGQEAVGLPVPVAFAELKWQKMLPELGDASPEIAIAHVDEKTKATQLYIRTPRKMHVPRHWHSSNETHTLLDGEFTVTCDRCGKRTRQGRGDFNFIPAKCIHQAWTTDGTLLFITVDAGWDVNWVDGPPTAAHIGVDPPKE